MSAITRTNQIHIQTRDRLDSGEGALSFNPIRLEEKLDNDFNFSLKGKVLDVTLIATTIIVVIGLVTSFVALLVGFISFLLGWIIFIPPALTLYCLWIGTGALGAAVLSGAAFILVAWLIKKNELFGVHASVNAFNQGASQNKLLVTPRAWEYFNNYNTELLTQDREQKALRSKAVFDTLMAEKVPVAALVAIINEYDTLLAKQLEEMEGSE